MMKRVAEKNISPDEKLLKMIYTRLDAVKEVVYRNGTLRAYFFRTVRCVLLASVSSDTVIPVSYTHLDVYKRQPYQLATWSFQYCCHLLNVYFSRKR